MGKKNQLCGYNYKRLEQSGKFRKLHLSTVMQPLKPKDSTYITIQGYPKSKTISSLMSQCQLNIDTSPSPILRSGIVHTGSLSRNYWDAQLEMSHC